MATADSNPPAEEQPSASAAQAESGASVDATSRASAPDIPGNAGDEAKAPVFSELPESRQQRAGGLERFYEVNIPVWAELGRVEMPIGELMRLDAGTVLRLERPVGEPVDIVSQGVTLARGEVVVVDDCFAVRIKEIHDSK